MNMANNRIPLWITILLGISFVFLITFHPSANPPLWFDEGWTLSVARNWVETGQYARFLNDTPISATGMAWNFPVTGPIALSFRIFGIGILQGRLPGILFTLGSVTLIYILARHMYGEKIAALTFLVLIIGFPIPLTYGRQAIGEPAMMFYLLAGIYAPPPSVSTYAGGISPKPVPLAIVTGARGYNYPLRADVPRRFKTQLVSPDSDVTEDDCAHRFVASSEEILRALIAKVNAACAVAAPSTARRSCSSTSISAIRHCAPRNRSNACSRSSGLLGFLPSVTPASLPKSFRASLRASALVMPAYYHDRVFMSNRAEK
jgi:hypothetical protein